MTFGNTKRMSDIQGPRTCRWCFTSYQVTAPVLDAKYLVWQREQCPTTGKVHLQGFVILSHRARLSQLKKIDSTIHWEPARGTDEQCIAYCSKEDTRLDGPYESGTRPSEKKTLDSVIEFVDKNPGATTNDIRDFAPALFVRNYRGIMAYMQKHRPPCRSDIKVIVATGPPGIGKTRWAYETYPEAYWKEPSTEFFDGYEGESVLIFDDFHGNLPFEVFLRILDRYPCRLNVKGSMVPLRANTIVITSNTPVADWYPGVFQKHPVRLDALLRRIHEYVDLSNPVNKPDLL